MNYPTDELQRALALYKQKSEAWEALAENQRLIIENYKAMERFNAEMHTKLEQENAAVKTELAKMQQVVRNLKQELETTHMASHVSIINNYGNQGTVMNSVDEVSVREAAARPL